MPKTYIDLSHIANWGGRLSGIERVEFNIIKHYLETEDSQFVCWQTQTGKFHLKTKANVQEFITSIEITQQKVTAPAQSPPSLMTRVVKKLRPDRVAEPIASMESSDTLVVLDGLWDKQPYIDALKDIAQIASVHHIVYDMIPALCPSFVLDFMPPIFTHYMKAILPLCKHVYAISENTAKDTRQVLRDWGVAVPPIDSFRLGDDVLVSAHQKRKQKEPFVLATGTIEVRKNYPLLMYAYLLAKERGIDLPPTYIAGKRGWLSGDFQYQVENDEYLKMKLIMLDNVTDNELAQLYDEALLAVCPSYYEGWGLPVREALAHGRVTLSSNTSSLPEAGGEFADYFSPYRPDELLKLMTIYLDNKKRQKKEAAIAAGYKTFTWAEAAKAFAELVARN